MPARTSVRPPIPPRPGGTRPGQPVGRHAGGRALRTGGLLLGVAASGFFDGILLHQLLQWHHLLSAVSAPGRADIERQILADGWFHVLMYGLAALSLWLLWRARGALAGAVADRSLLVQLLWGFGLWNVLDALLFHWLLGLHRVRMDSTQPLAWDIGWLLLTGGLPIALARWLGRAGSGGGDDPGDAVDSGTARPPAPGQRTAPAPLTGGEGIRWRLGVPRRLPQGALPWGMLAGMTLALALWSARPVAGAAEAPVLLVFYPFGTGGAQAMAGVHAVDARVIDVNADGTVWALAMARGASRIPLFLHGARAVAEVPAWAGCAQRLKL
ncbi:MAG: hypothetical protein JWQ88_553 [Rhodoferax sp.]|nr:hypothetical protein [Rhodoferax sp.]